MKSTVNSLTPKDSSAASQRVRQFLDDLQEAKQIYQCLIKLSERQSHILETRPTDGLIELAQAKSDEMAKLDRAERRIQATRSSWDSLKAELSESERSKVQQAITDVERVLRQLLEIEEQEKQALEKRRQETVEQIQQLDKARKATRAYGPHATGGSTHLDQRE